MTKLEKLYDKLVNELTDWGPHVLGAIVVFIVGNWVINWFTKRIKNGLMKKELDNSLQSFLSSMIGVVLKVLLLVTVAGMMGIQTTSFVAILGAAGLAVGLALQGSLANFAGGVLVLVFKPYKVGDFIESQGIFGEVKEIQIFNTIVLMLDNKTAILPNGAVSNGSIINHSKHGNVRLDVQVNVDHKNDTDKLISYIQDALKKDDRILKSPAPVVEILKWNDSSVTITIRPCCMVEVYWDVHFTTNRLVKQIMDEHKIILPEQEIFVVKRG